MIKGMRIVLFVYFLSVAYFLVVLWDLGYRSANLLNHRIALVDLQHLLFSKKVIAGFIDVKIVNREKNIQLLKTTTL